MLLCWIYINPHAADEHSPFYIIMHTNGKCKCPDAECRMPRGGLPDGVEDDGMRQDEILCHLVIRE